MAYIFWPWKIQKISDYKFITFVIFCTAINILIRIWFCSAVCIICMHLYIFVNGIQIECIKMQIHYVEFQFYLGDSCTFIQWLNYIEILYSKWVKSITGPKIKPKELSWSKLYQLNHPDLQPGQIFQFLGIIFRQTLFKYAVRMKLISVSDLNFQFSQKIQKLRTYCLFLHLS